LLLASQQQNGDCGANAVPNHSKHGQHAKRQNAAASFCSRRRRLRSPIRVLARTGKGKIIIFS